VYHRVEMLADILNVRTQGVNNIQKELLNIRLGWYI